MTGVGNLATTGVQVTDVGQSSHLGKDYWVNYCHYLFSPSFVRFRLRLNICGKESKSPCWDHGRLRKIRISFLPLSPVILQKEVVLYGILDAGVVPGSGC